MLGNSISVYNSKGSFSNPSTKSGANFVTTLNRTDYEPTLENFRATVIIHEFYVHGILKYGDENDFGWEDFRNALELKMKR